MLGCPGLFSSEINKVPFYVRPRALSRRRNIEVGGTGGLTKRRAVFADGTFLISHRNRVRAFATWFSVALAGRVVGRLQFGVRWRLLSALDATARPVLLKKRNEYGTSMRMHNRVHMFLVDRPRPLKISKGELP